MSTPDYRSLWDLRPGVAYLNHGSFGPSPRSVQAARWEWMQRLESEPMDFFVRTMDGHLDTAREALAKWLRAKADRLVFVDNATFAMNIIASGFPLASGDEVLANDHEYGAVLRIWRKACAAANANLVVQSLPEKFHDAEVIAEAFLAGVTARTKLIVISHITSPTAVTFPVELICRKARQLGVPVCVDGPHAPAAVDVDLERLGCDFYTASLHKWLSAPFGSGFLYAHPRWRPHLPPAITSWGASLSGHPPSWRDEFVWSGTRDPSAFLAVPSAIEFLEQAGWETFRSHAFDLVGYAREKIVAWTGLEPQVPHSREFCATMVTLPLPAHVPEPLQPHAHQWQHLLWERHKIEVPIVNWRGRRFVRVSAHLYNTRAEIDLLSAALQELSVSASAG